MTESNSDSDIEEDEGESSDVLKTEDNLDRDRTKSEMTVEKEDTKEVNLEENVKKDKKEDTPKSKYKHVSWYAPQRKWQAQLNIDGKKYWCRRHTSKIDAAHAINRKCDELGIERKHPDIGDPPELDGKKNSNKKKEAKTKSKSKSDSEENSNEGDEVNGLKRSVRKSRFIGVVFNARNGIWQANGSIDGKATYLSSSKSEEECAKMARQKIMEYKADGKTVANAYGQLREEKKPKPKPKVKKPEAKEKKSKSKKKLRVEDDGPTIIDITYSSDEEKATSAEPSPEE